MGQIQGEHFTSYITIFSSPTLYLLLINDSSWKKFHEIRYSIVMPIWSYIVRATKTLVNDFVLLPFRENILYWKFPLLFIGCMKILSDCRLLSQKYNFFLSIFILVLEKIIVSKSFYSMTFWLLLVPRIETFSCSHLSSKISQIMETYSPRISHFIIIETQGGKGTEILEAVPGVAIYEVQYY